MNRAALIPWTQVHSWSCKACGNCCLGYRVPLKIEEYIKVGQLYGPNVMEYGVGKAYLKNRRNGRCILQRPLMGRWICTLQSTKPTACRLFPFRIHKTPMYKRGDAADINFKGNIYYLYLDPDCKGIIVGQPSDRFKNYVIPEIMSIGIGLPVKQKYTTSKNIHWKPI